MSYMRGRTYIWGDGENVYVWGEADDFWPESGWGEQFPDGSAGVKIPQVDWDRMLRAASVRFDLPEEPA